MIVDYFRRLAEERRDLGECRLGRYGTFWSRVAVSAWSGSVALCKFGNDDDTTGRWVLHLFCLWVTLGQSRTPPKDEMLDRWGWSFCDGLHLSWGHRRKIVHYPWAGEWVRTEWMMADGATFVVVEQAGRWPHWVSGYHRLYHRADGSLTPPRPYVKGRVRDWCDDHTPTTGAPRYTGEFPYTYVLRSGEVQHRTATVTVERMTWCWRLFWRLGVWFPKRVRTSIWVKFSDEVGERTGSWKGGTVGCGYDIRPGETPEQALRRMEADRKF